MRRAMMAAGVVAGTLLMGGCAKELTEEAAAAKQAVEGAQGAGAAKYAADDFAKVQGNLKAAEDELKAQREKFALFRSYDKAKDLLAKAKADGERVQKDVVVKKEEAKRAAEAAEQEAKAAVESAKALLTKAPGGKGTKADISAMREDLRSLEASLQDVRAALEKGDFLGAKAKATGITEMAGKDASDVQQAIAKVAVAKQGKKK